ncbi:hypothetical protein E3J49_04475 [Candidatus Bathyarchaeota archaeon]|nr:MAG: hypothetical protein E3J49_04475 [Candidatus Bathyarchaeota archaeon]
MPSSNLSLNYILDALQPILQEYQKERAQIDEQITREGKVPSYLCHSCERKSIIEVNRLMAPKEQIPRLLEWMRTNDVRELESDGEVLSFKSTKKAVEKVEGTINLISIGGVLGPITREELYEYRLSALKLKKRQCYDIVALPFEAIRACNHLDTNAVKESTAVRLTLSTRLRYEPHSPSVESLWTKELTRRELRLLCPECNSRIDMVGCEDSVRKDGFIYKFTFCPVRRVTFEQLLEKHNIRFTAQETDRRYSIQKELNHYLPELHTVVIESFRDLENLVQIAQPTCVLTFGTKADMIRCLGLGTHVIIVEEGDTGRVFVFDKDKKVEKTIDKIVQAIMEKIEPYSNAIRGKEHDRLVAAFQRIGQELGFVVQPELQEKGSRVDLVWFDRGGNVHTAIEVETSAQWKKDIVTTWEVSPKLAVILTHYKTDKGITDAIQYKLLEKMPHKLLMINYLLKKGYLIEGQQIVKYYDMVEPQKEKTWISQV